MFNLILTYVSTLVFFIITELIAICLTCYTIVLLSKKSPEQTFLSQIKVLLKIILLGSFFENVSWLINILKLSLWPEIDLRLIFLFIRLAWIFTIGQYQSFNLLIEYLIPNQSKFLLLINRLTLLISLIYVTIFGWLIGFKTLHLERPNFELTIFDNISYYYIPIMIMIGLIFTLIILTNRHTPSVLRKLLHTFNLTIIGPTIISNAIQIYLPSQVSLYFSNYYTVIGILALFIAVCFYTCVKRMIYLDNFTHQNNSVESF